MSDLLKEAIADAKAVRATALANAKAALEESFKPTLEAMLAEKLKSEIGDDVPAQSSRISNPSPAHPNHDSDEHGHHPLRVDRYADNGQGLQEEEEVTSEELDEILAELEREMGDEPTAPALAPTEPAAEIPAPAPVDPMMDAPAPEAPESPESPESPAESDLTSLIHPLTLDLEFIGGRVSRPVLCLISALDRSPAPNSLT